MAKRKNENLLKAIESLSAEDVAFIKRLFENYLAKDRPNSFDLANLSRALRMHFNTEIEKALMQLVFGKTNIKKLSEKLYTKFENAIKLVKELRALYEPKINDVYLEENWPNGIRRIRMTTTIELQKKVPVHSMILFTNDGQRYEFRQPLDITLKILIDLVKGAVSSIEEIEKANIKPALNQKSLKTLRKQLAKIDRILKE